MERVERIELSYSVWKTDVLPLNYTRLAWVEGIEPPLTVLEAVVLPLDHTHLAEWVGFEPTAPMRAPH